MATNVKCLTEERALVNTSAAQTVDVLYTTESVAPRCKSLCVYVASGIAFQNSCTFFKRQGDQMTLDNGCGAVPQLGFLEAQLLKSCHLQAISGKVN